MSLSKMVVVDFKSETQAYEGLSALKNLLANNDFTLYDAVVISKSDDKPIVKSFREDGGKGTIAGLLGGSLIGLQKTK